ncbi:MAG: cobyric acid synthase [Clostridiales bacterium]|nr:cobyric acid synthase [Clostridiales bacterium]
MAKSIMIQGTMSNAGKSLLAAGLCRIFKQDGFSVAPFKSQNMALNSFVTEEGLEMGRAQVMQAEAAGAEPSVQMNPILLKPTNDVGSQVIINGEVLGTMDARDYFQYKKKLVPDIMRAYRALDEAYDIIVIEGAGSPAEINLKQDDIVNMGMARLAKAPVLLVGDIDRGGVFAQLVGTVMLLEEGEREMVKGLVINKFRGDRTILDPGVEMLEQLTDKSVVGVVPYMDIDLEDEDSLSERMDGSREAKLIDIAVVRFPRISNFTDFNIFESIDGVSVRYVKKPVQLGYPDLIFLPGTKNTMGDLRWMRQSGMEAAVRKAKKKGTVIFGICGGYQMLGMTLSDPDCVEEGGTVRGMELLPMDTVFAPEKTRTRVEGKFARVEGVLSGLSGLAFDGYEIHMGQSFSAGALPGLNAQKTGEYMTPLAGLRDCVHGEQKDDGIYCDQVYGSYVHGLFDREEVAGAVVQALAARRGIDLSAADIVDYASYKEEQYDRLADILREHLDMDRIYEILEQGV